MQMKIMTKEQMGDTLKRVVRHPHAEFHKGGVGFVKSVIEDDCYNTFISPAAMLDCTDNIFIGAHCMIGHYTSIYTHDHYHEGKKPLLEVQAEKGVKHSPLVIGNDVWLHGCTILNQVTKIPDGVVVGANSVLTKNPGAYEIWAGNPARKIGERK